jgi:hypothetical protein
VRFDNIVETINTNTISNEDKKLISAVFNRLKCGTHMSSSA